MSHEIQQREHEGIVILDFKGRITVGQEASALREKVAAVTAAGSKNIILNLLHVDYIDSTGLGALVMCATSQRKAGGALKLENLNRRNIELLVMTKSSILRRFRFSSFSAPPALRWLVAHMTSAPKPVLSM